MIEKNSNATTPIGITEQKKIEKMTPAQCAKELGITQKAFSRGKKLLAPGWGNARIDRNMSCGSWPEPHVRITVWCLDRPCMFGRNGKAIGHPFVCADAETVKMAWVYLAVQIKRVEERAEKVGWVESTINNI